MPKLLMCSMLSAMLYYLVRRDACLPDNKLSNL